MIASVPAGPIPGARGDDEPLQDWMIAIIAAVAGVLLLAIVVLALCCFKRRKKDQGGKEACALRGVLRYISDGDVRMRRNCYIPEYPPPPRVMPFPITFGL